MFEEFELIHRYTRAQAIEDGVLIDVSTVAREAGITYPVALTRAAWERCVTVPPGVLCQDESGRLWDVLTMFRLAARNASGDRLTFGVHVRNSNRPWKPPVVRFKAVCGPGDDTAPVVTIMLADED